MAQETIGTNNGQQFFVGQDPSNVISSAALQPTPTVTPVVPTPDTTNYPGITGGVTDSIIADYKKFNDQQTAAQNTQTDTGKSILDLMRELEGKTADTQAANDAAGVTAENANLTKYGQQLADLNGQAASLNREAQAIPIQTQQNAANTGATDRGVAPQDAGALRLNALKALSLGQQADVLAAATTGSTLRLNAAKDKAQQIIDLKYKPIEDELALKQKQYDLNKDTLDAIDKKRSESLQVALTKEANDLQDKKAAQKTNVQLAIDSGVQTKYVNQNGKFFSAADGTEFSTPQELFKAAGISIPANPSPADIAAGFKQMYDMGLVTDFVSPKTEDSINSVIQEAAKNGADAATLQNIKKSKSAADAVIAAGTFINPKPTPAAYNGSPEAQGFSSPPTGGFRTDRNNNPVAMTTDVARSLGLVEGKDYIVGDKFPGSSNLYTAHLLGDPIDTVIKGLDNAAASGRGAFVTASGKPRWSYINMTDAQWQAMTPDQKKQTVIGMYKKEGGSGQLVNPVSGDTAGTVTKYVTDSNNTTWKVTTKNGVQTSKTEQKTSDAVPQNMIEAAGASLQANTGRAKAGANAGPKDDNYVSPQDYNDGLQQWVGAGYSAKSYYDNFKKFVNPDHAKDYNYYPN